MKNIKIVLGLILGKSPEESTRIQREDPRKLRNDTERIQLIIRPALATATVSMSSGRSEDPDDLLITFFADDQKLSALRRVIGEMAKTTILDEYGISTLTLSATATPEEENNLRLQVEAVLLNININRQAVITMNMARPEPTIDYDN